MQKRSLISGINGQDGSYRQNLCYRTTMKCTVWSVERVPSIHVGGVTSARTHITPDTNCISRLGILLAMSTPLRLGLQQTIFWHEEVTFGADMAVHR